MSDAPARIDWKTATEAEKNAAIARTLHPEWEVESHWGDENDNAIFKWRLKDDPRPGYEKPWSGIPDYLHSVDELLPWTERSERFDIHRVRSLPPHYRGVIWIGYADNEIVGESASLPEALAIALLRAAGVEVRNE